MAVSLANQEIIWRGKYTVAYVEITLDSSYASGGETLNASDFGFANLKGVWPGATEGYVVEYVPTNPSTGVIKVYAFSNSTNTVLGQIVTGKDLSAATLTCLVVGQ